MKINTLHFGELEIDENSILCFEEGIPGFEDIKKFVVLTDEIGETDKTSETPFRWLQAVEQEHPAFVMVNPFEVKTDYEFDIDDATIEMLDIKNPSDVAIYSIVVIPEDITQMTTNLKAPIIINTANNKGRQMIMDKSQYETKHYILHEIIKGKAQEQEAK